MALLTRAPSLLIAICHHPAPCCHQQVLVVCEKNGTNIELYTVLYHLADVDFWVAMEDKLVLQQIIAHHSLEGHHSQGCNFLLKENDIHASCFHYVYLIAARGT